MPADRDADDFFAGKGYPPEFVDERSDDPDLEPTPEELSEMREADREAIRDRFEKRYEPKLSRIREFHQAGYEDEAFLLALCYIDGLASWLYPKERPFRRRFALLLLEQGGVERLCDIPTKSLRSELERAFASDKKVKNRVRSAGVDVDDFRREIDEVLSSISEETLTLESAEALFARRMDRAETALVKSELYRGTNAGLLYKHYRNPLVHALGLHEVDLVLPDNSIVSFGLWEAEPLVPFDEVHTALANVLAIARRGSLEAASLFNSDRVGDPKPRGGG